MSAAKVPLNIFGMGFGLAGLATTWRIAVTVDLADAWVAVALVIVAACVWLMSVLLYARYVIAHPGALRHDLQDMTVGPFASLAIITPVLLVANGVAPYAHQAATIMIDVLIVATVLLGGWFTGFWMRGGADLDRLHPGYFLPTVAGGFVASAGAAEVGQERLALVMFGLALICWAIVGSMILGRLIFRPPLVEALTPTMAIEVAPAAVASIALFFASDGRITTPITILAGYGILMVSAQVPLLPRYLKLPFSLGTWSFTFSWAAVASASILWIAAGHHTSGRVWSYLILVAITTLIGAVACRTLLSAAHRRLLPQVAPTAANATPA
jgi:tellurite resistance protein